MIMLLMGLAIILLTMVLIGWLTFAKSENEAAIRIRTWKIKQDVQALVDTVQAFLDRTGRKFRERRSRTRESEPRSTEHDDHTHSPARHESRQVHGT